MAMQCSSTINSSLLPTLVMKTVKTQVPAVSSHWVGDAFKVFPVFNNLAFTNDISPFLMFDYGAPNTFQPSSKRRGVGQHPHRGFETVTLAFQGEVQHHDSQGNTGIIGPGDVQWMTAARGIVHEEYLSPNFLKTGGVVEMCQLWVNLPRKLKMTDPKYQAILVQDIKNVELADGCGVARIIAGSLNGSRGPADTHSPIDLWELQLRPGKPLTICMPEGHNTILFVRRGRIRIGQSDKVYSSSPSPATVLLSLEGSAVQVLPEGDEEPSVLVLSGQPLNEPIAARGPFVMNTNEELSQAMRDYQNGEF